MVFFYLCENQKFILNFFNWSALNSIKKVKDNPGEETQYVKCDHFDKNASFKNDFRKCSMTKQNRPYTNTPVNCYVYQEHHDTKNCPTNHDKCI